MTKKICEESAQKILNKAELKAKIETILFCVTEGVTIETLANKLNLGMKDDVKELLLELQKEYENKAGGIRLVQDGELWKFKIPDEHTELVRNAALPEFDQPTLETLAYIAWRGGARQCDTVRVRSNKAYNHIKLLIEKGFIEAHKSGLSKWLEPTKKFYDYFKIDKGQKLPVPEEVEKRLEEAERAAKEQEQKEAEAAKAIEEQKQQAEPNSTNSQ